MRDGDHVPRGTPLQFSSTMRVASSAPILPVADPGFLQGGFKIHERARNEREKVYSHAPFL